MKLKTGVTDFSCSKQEHQWRLRMRLCTFNIIRAQALMKYFTKEELGPKFFQITFLWLLGTLAIFFWGIPKSESYSEPSETPTMETFAKKVQGW